MARMVHDIEDALDAAQEFYDSKVVELEDRIDELEDENRALEGRVDDLEEEVASLESQLEAEWIDKPPMGGIN
jgi:polyhydroxyalkanoate synthesis regulator phasin